MAPNVYIGPATTATKPSFREKGLNKQVYLLEKKLGFEAQKKTSTLNVSYNIFFNWFSCLGWVKVIKCIILNQH